MVVTSTFKTERDVREALYDKIAESGLDQAFSTRLGFVSYMANEVAPKLGLPVQKAGFLIPYHDINGQKTKFWRFRFLESSNSGFAAHTDKSEASMRYTSHRFWTGRPLPRM